MEQEQRIAEGGQQIFNNVDILDNSSENPFCFNNEWIIDGADYLRAFFKAFGYGSIGLILSSIVVLPIVGLLALCSPLILVALVVWGISKLFKKEVQEETEEDKEFNKDYMVKIMAVLCVLTVGLLIAFGTIPGITLTTWQWIAVAGIVSFMANGILNRKALAQTATGATDEICSTLRRKDSDIWFAAEEEKAAQQHEDNTSTIEISPDDVPSEEVDVEDLLATKPEQPTVNPTASNIVGEAITETIVAEQKAVLLTKGALNRTNLPELQKIAETYDIDTTDETGEILKVRKDLIKEIWEAQVEYVAARDAEAESN